MSRKAWLLLAVVVAVGLTAAPALGQSTAHIKVSPKYGGKNSGFGVSFQAPATLGSGTASEYTVSASGPSQHGCVGLASDSVTSAQQGQTVHVMLKPGARKRWCVGKFQGEIKEIIRPSCGCPPTAMAKSMIVCPLNAAMICMRPQFIGVVPVGKFSFHVQRHPSRKGAAL